MISFIFLLYPSRSQFLNTKPSRKSPISILLQPSTITLHPQQSPKLLRPSLLHHPSSLTHSPSSFILRSSLASSTLLLLVILLLVIAVARRRCHSAHRRYFHHRSTQILLLSFYFFESEISFGLLRLSFVVCVFFLSL